jgi:hypothetical protein
MLARPMLLPGPEKVTDSAVPENCRPVSNQRQPVGDPAHEAESVMEASTVPRAVDAAPNSHSFIRERRVEEI